MLTLAIFTSLISLPLILVLPLASYIITILFSFYFVKRRFLHYPISSVFVICFNLLFLVGMVIQLSLGFTFEDKFGVFSEQSVQMYHFLSNGFIQFYLITLVVKEYFSKPVTPINLVSYYLPGKGINRYILLAIGMMISSILLFTLDYGGLSNIVTMTRVDLGQNRTLLSIIGIYIAYFATPIFFVLGIVYGNRAYKGFTRKTVLLLSCLVFSIFIFLVFRIRTFVVAHLFAWFLGYLLSVCFLPTQESTKAPTKFNLPFLKYALYGTTLIFVLVLLRFKRGALDVGTVNVLTWDNVMVMLELTVIGGDLGYHYNVIRILEFAWAGDLQVGWDSYIRTLTAIIPTSILEGKPTDTQIVIGQLFDPYVPGLTVPPGIIGDAYLNLTYFWPLFPVLLCLLVSLVERYRNPTMIVFYAIIFSTVFHFSRGSLANTMIIFFILLIASYFFTLITDMKMIAVQSENKSKNS